MFLLYLEADSCNTVPDSLSSLAVTQPRGHTGTSVAVQVDCGCPRPRVSNQCLFREILHLFEWCAILQAIYINAFSWSLARGRARTRLSLVRTSSQAIPNVPMLQMVWISYML